MKAKLPSKNTSKNLSFVSYGSWTSFWRKFFPLTKSIPRCEVQHEIQTETGKRTWYNDLEPTVFVQVTTSEDGPQTYWY